MKKIIHYLFVSIIFALMFTVVDVLSNKVIFNQGIGGMSNLITGGLGLSGLGGGFDITDIGMGKTEKTNGVCSDKNPLLLTSGECVGCSYNGNADILLGCEKCQNVKESKCLFKMENSDKKNVSPNKESKPTPQKPVYTHKYKLIKIMGVGDKMRVLLMENATKQKKFILVGDVLDGATVKSISAFDGIIVEKNGALEPLDIGM